MNERMNVSISTSEDCKYRRERKEEEEMLCEVINKIDLIINGKKEERSDDRSTRSIR